MTIQTLESSGLIEQTETVEDGLRCQLDKAQKQIENLQIALQSSRTIGTAIGVLVERFKVSPDDGFAMLVAVSQHAHRKVRDIAEELVFTGALPDR